MDSHVCCNSVDGLYVPFVSVDSRAGGLADLSRSAFVFC